MYNNVHMYVGHSISECTDSGLFMLTADLTNKEGTMFLEKSKTARKLMMRNG